MMETSSRVQPRGHRSVPDVGACELGPRRNVNSTPKKCKSPRDGSCYTDPVPSRTRRRNEQDSFTPGRHLPAHMSPIRPRRASWGIDCSVPGSSPGVRKLSFVGECPGSVRGNPGGSPQAYERMFMSTTSSDGPICRICHDGDQAGPLSSYCSCSGTGLTHVHGLESWVSPRNTEVWESCQNRFPSMQSRRPLADWISGQQRRALVFDLGCFVLLSPIAFFGLKLSVQGAGAAAAERQSPLAAASHRHCRPTAPRPALLSTRAQACFRAAFAPPAPLAPLLPPCLASCQTLPPVESGPVEKLDAMSEAEAGTKTEEQAKPAAAAAAPAAAEEAAAAPPVKEMRAVVLTGFGGLKTVKILQKARASGRR
ncbi:hypothetical protein HPB47_007794, partial [Ixodes persulcatus]